MLKFSSGWALKNQNILHFAWKGVHPSLAPRSCTVYMHTILWKQLCKWIRLILQREMGHTCGLYGIIWLCYDGIISWCISECILWLCQWIALACTDYKGPLAKHTFSYTSPHLRWSFSDMFMLHINIKGDNVRSGEENETVIKSSWSTRKVYSIQYSHGIQLKS